MDDAGKPYDLSQARCCVIANTGSGRKAGASIADLLQDRLRDRVASLEVRPVSYTHLTLPTILLV